MTLDSTSTAHARKLRRQADRQHSFHLSVVATSRNDDHGGHLLARMQHFVDGFVAQCRRHDLAAELILVEWNPPPDRLPLAEALRWPEELGPSAIRIITVPPGVHARLAHADKLPLFQMIAKNIGIRRARGRFVLATNIDILFSDEVVRFMRDRLRGGRLYRVDRCDVSPEVPASVPFDQVLGFCEREMFRINRRASTLVKLKRGWVRQPLREDLGSALRLLRGVRALRRKIRAVWPRLLRKLRAAPRVIATSPGTGLREAVRVARRAVAELLWAARMLQRRVVFKLRWRFDPNHRLHTNACGDFTLLSREDWYRLRGYPEWEIFSWHLDSVLLYQANRNGIREVDLPETRRVYHIEHGTGSGYTPEGAAALFARLEAKGVPYLDWPDFIQIVAEMDTRRKAGKPVIYNPESWGLVDEDLPETVVRSLQAATRTAAGS